MAHPVRMNKDDLEPIDAAELVKFEMYMRLVSEGKTQTDAYAEVYGEVVYDKSGGA